MKHHVSAGGVVININGDVLVVSQRGTSWSLPKGHVKEGEDLITTAKREIREETGITELQFVKNLGSYTRPRIDNPAEIKTIHFYLFKTNQMDLKPTDPKNPEAKWVSKNDIEKMLTAPKDKEFFMAIKKTLPVPKT